MNRKKDCEPYNPLPEYLAIGPSDIHGAGILAKEDIPGEVVIGVIKWLRKADLLIK